MGEEQAGDQEAEVDDVEVEAGAAQDEVVEQVDEPGGAQQVVEQARVVRSIPSLDESALVAVKQWKYKPTIVNGVAVPVTMLVHVAFGSTERR